MQVALPPDAVKTKLEALKKSQVSKIFKQKVKLLKRKLSADNYYARVDDIGSALIRMTPPLVKRFNSYLRLGTSARIALAKMMHADGKLITDSQEVVNSDGMKILAELKIQWAEADKRVEAVKNL